LAKVKQYMCVRWNTLVKKINGIRNIKREAASGVSAVNFLTT